MERPGAGLSAPGIWAYVIGLSGPLNWSYVNTASGHLFLCSSKRPMTDIICRTEQTGLNITGYIQACLGLEADLPWGRDVFYKTGLETTRTSPKPLTNKLYQVLTSRTDRLDGRNIHNHHEQTSSRYY